jgi:large subunit ribosomal protein L22
MSGDARAKMRYAPTSAQKMREVMTAVRGRKAEAALAYLQAMPQTAAARLAKLLKSAIANAVQNQGLHKEELVIAQMFANEGPTRKWRRFGARGRFKPILRRSSHVTIVLREEE